MIGKIKGVLKRILFIERLRNLRMFLIDEDAFWMGTHAPYINEVANYEARLTMLYHVVEKGLTMPNRRMEFGKSIILQLIKVIDEGTIKDKDQNAVVRYAVGVVKAYLELHEIVGCDFAKDCEFWRRVKSFASRYPDVPISRQWHIKRADFYSRCDASFLEFANSRHTIRHYSDVRIPVSQIRSAVEIATTTPSACNRHHARVHCVVNREIARRILEIQGGTRGFGHLADKVLIVTSDLSVEMTCADNFDPYVNGGLFLMNLCYSLHYHKIAHCILTCSIDRRKLREIKRLAQIPVNEVFVGMLSCGIAPDEFDVAASPRKSVDEVLSIVE